MYFNKISLTFVKPEWFFDYKRIFKNKQIYLKATNIFSSKIIDGNQ